MRIAVTYDNDNIFQHFGHTAQFKVYDVENGQIVKAEVIDTNGSGHGALAGFLQANGVDVLICGGIGGGAQMALKDAGIRCEFDNRNEKIGYLIREARQVDRVPYMLIIGEKEIENNCVSVRNRDTDQTTSMSLDEFLAQIKNQIATRS